MTSLGYQKLIQRAASIIAKADAILITAGAGMSVDSGLPDFRSKGGIYDMLRAQKSRLKYYDVMNHYYFVSAKNKFWYIYAYRY